MYRLTTSTFDVTMFDIKSFFYTAANTLWILSSKNRFVFLSEVANIHSVRYAVVGGWC